MKKWKLAGLSVWILCLSLGLSFLSVRADAEELSTLSAQAAAVIDLNTGTVLLGKNTDQRQHSGGLAKLMTVLLLAEQHDLGERTAFSEILYDVGESGTRLGLQPGEEISLYDAACAILLGSADDVSNGIAEYAAGSPEAFVSMMNARAQELGCVNTYFSDLRGLSDESYSSARDFALIARAAYQNAAVREICGLTEYTVGATNLTGSTRQLQADKQLLLQDSPYYLEQCVGGIDEAAGEGMHNLVAFGSSGEGALAAVILGAPGAEQACTESAQLFEQGFASLPGQAAEPVDGEVKQPSQTAEPAADDPLQSEAVQAEAVQTEAIPVEIEIQIGAEPAEAQTGTAPAADASRSGGAAEAGQNVMLNWILGAVSGGYQNVSDYAEEHFVVIFAGGCIFLFVLLVAVVLLMLRCVTDARIRRERKKTERIRREKEAQIERMTLEEVETELRKKTER